MQPDRTTDLRRVLNDLQGLRFIERMAFHIGIELNADSPEFFQAQLAEVVAARSGR